MTLIKMLKVYKKDKFPCNVCRRVQTVIPSSVSFAGVRYLKDVVVSKVIL